MNISFLGNFGCFWDKMPKRPFLGERKNDRFSVIPAQTGSAVILGHFFMAQTVQTISLTTVQN